MLGRKLVAFFGPHSAFGVPAANSGLPLQTSHLQCNEMKITTLHNTGKTPVEIEEFHAYDEIKILFKGLNLLKKLFFV